MEKYKLAKKKNQKISPNKKKDIKKSQIKILELKNITEIKSSEYGLSSRWKKQERINKLDNITKPLNLNNRKI